jgi:hypothetical protein
VVTDAEQSLNEITGVLENYSKVYNTALLRTPFHVCICEDTHHLLRYFICSKVCDINDSLTWVTPVKDMGVQKKSSKL